MEANFVTYGSEFRKYERFGYGMRYEANPAAKTKEALEKEAIKGAWRNGCPRVLSLISPESEYDVEWMVQRYAETNFWFRWTLDIAKRNNLAVKQWLSTPRVRLLPFEPMGVHEPVSVPDSHHYKISPMSGVEGYAVPRVAIEVARLYGGTNGSAAVEMVANKAQQAGNEPDTFLPFLAESAVLAGVNAATVLHHVYPQGILDEENCRTTYILLANRFAQYAPTLWNEYGRLSDKEKSNLKIADVPKSSLAA